MKPWYEVTQEDQDAIMTNTTWNASDKGCFRGGDYSSRFETKAQMPATMIRLNLVKGYSKGEVTHGRIVLQTNTFRFSYIPRHTGGGQNAPGT